MNSAEISTYKIKIIRHLLEDPELVSLLDANGEFEYPDDMIYDRIYPFGRVPGTEQEVKSYITIMVDVPTINQRNDMIRDVTLTVRVLSHTDLMKVNGKNGDRIDLMSARIDTLLNESYDFGIGYVKLVYNKEFVLDSTHFYRELKFQTDGINSRRYGA